MLGERIRGLRESAGLTQEALARSADIGRVTLVSGSRMESRPPGSGRWRPSQEPWGNGSKSCYSLRGCLSDEHRRPVRNCRR